jgi:hypothetical protein
LLCYHYRIISNENNLNKFKNNSWYIRGNAGSLNDLKNSDHSEIIDETLKNKVEKRENFNQQQIYIKDRTIIYIIIFILLFYKTLSK